MGRYVYDGFARRRLKESAGAEARRFHYDLAGNLIEEAGPDGNARRAWVYVNGHRIAMVRPTAAALVIPPINCNLPCGSIASEADAWATWVLATLIVLAIMGKRRTGWAVASVAATVVVVQCAGDGTGEKIANAVTVPGVDVYYYHNDHLDTPRALSDESGAVVWSATYSAFGQRTITGTSVEQPFVFPGQYADAETGLYYNWHRYYNPVWGRYVSGDPILEYSFLRANIMSISKSFQYRPSRSASYSYVTNSPINFIDSRGLICEWSGFSSYMSLGAPGKKLYMPSPTGSYYEFHLSSACCNGVKVTGSYAALLFGPSWGSPVGWGGGFTRFLGDNTPDVDDPVGRAILVSVFTSNHSGAHLLSAILMQRSLLVINERLISALMVYLVFPMHLGSLNLPVAGLSCV